MRRTTLQAMLLVLLHCRHLILAQDWCVPSCSCTEEDLGARIADCSYKHWLNVDSEMLGNELHVQGLDLSHNSIAGLSSFFPDNMKGRWRLLALSVSNNRISTVSPDALQGLTSLKSLDLSDNRIATLPREFLLVAPSLRALSLDGNRILPNRRENGGALLEGPNLTRLSLQRCNLGYLSPTALSKLPSLETLDVSANQLTEIPAELPPLLHRLEIFDNPLRCSDPEVRARLLKLEQSHTDCVLTVQDPNQPKRSEAMINAHDVGIPAVFAGLLCETVATSSNEDEDEFSGESMTLPASCDTTSRKPHWLHLWGMPAFWAASAGFLVGIMMSAWTVWCCQQMEDCCHRWCACCCRRRERTRSTHRESDATLLLGDSTPSLLVEDVNNPPPGTPPPPYGPNSVNYEDYAGWLPHHT